jgi:flagellar basal-body rod protein FlgF
MTDFMDAASAVLASAQRRVEVAAQNVSNMTTPGYRRRVSFEQALSAAGAGGGLPANTTSTDFHPGKPNNTGATLDLAISGAGFFTVRNGDETLYTRDGQFHLDQDGKVVTQGGMPVQLEGGGDLVLKGGQIVISLDGSVTEDGDAIGRLALTEFVYPPQPAQVDGGLFTSTADNLTSAKSSTVGQGVLESSNVSLGDEMVSIMQTLRSAEAGQKLVNVYDDLMGRAISTFGQG